MFSQSQPLFAFYHITSLSSTLDRPTPYALYRRRDIKLKLPSLTSCLAFPLSLAAAVSMISIDNRVGGSSLFFGLGGRH
jgi:hypothetical protein